MGRKRKPGFLQQLTRGVDSQLCCGERTVQPEVLPGVHRIREKPCQQMALGLFIKCGPSVDHAEVISAERFLLESTAC